jgi:uncharacterized membrane protein YdbT with pleckstrin-like domain
MTISEEMHDGENILKTLKPSRWSYILLYLIGIITLPFLGFGLLFIILAELLRGANTYYVTDERVIHEFTFLSRRVSSAVRGNIQDLHFTQGLIERIVGIGTIHINTAGTTFIEIKFRGVSDPSSVKRLIEEQMIQKSKADVQMKKLIEERLVGKSGNEEHRKPKVKIKRVEKETPLQVLKLRYAKGGITKKQFEKMKKALR